MKEKILKNPPLIEVIFELRWELLKGISSGINRDPNYKLIIGRMYEELKNEYPFYEQLLTAMIPDDISGYVVQHRFRKDKNKWPLIQIGPGIATLNDTEKYSWKDFKKRIIQLIDTLLKVYPENALKFNNIMLRYINAISFNFEKENIFNFLKDQMKVSMTFYSELFKSANVSKNSTNLDIRVSFPTVKPDGTITIRFARGKKQNLDALIWELVINSTSNYLPSDKDNILNWIEESHNLIEDWFFKLIEGELLRRFK